MPKTTITLPFHFGQVAMDQVSGLTGYIIGFSTYATGCDTVLLQPRSKEDDKKPEAEWVDIGRLKLMEAKPVQLIGLQASVSKEEAMYAPSEENTTPSRPGGDKPAPKR